MNSPDFQDHPPQTPGLTDYDRKHLALYGRLLDAEEGGADWTELVRALFGLHPKRDAEGARRVYDGHLSRSLWMTQHGFVDLTTIETSSGSHAVDEARRTFLT